MSNPVTLQRGRPIPANPLPRERKPPWFKVKAPGTKNYIRLKNLVQSLNLHTVCEEANCPNIGECWHHGTATFMILGDVCTRACGYCNVVHGNPGEVDGNEPARIAKAISMLELNYAVITSVDRDDLPDGGASIFAETIRATRTLRPTCRLEVLIPDFQGKAEPLHAILQSKPDVLNHNLETVSRLYRTARPGGKYDRALELLSRSHALQPTIPTKSGLMVGLGEYWNEVITTLQDLYATGCKRLTIGQYLRPSTVHLPVARYYHPDEFNELACIAKDLGFKHVESGPLVRSSYHAHEQADAALT